MRFSGQQRVAMSLGTPPAKTIGTASEFPLKIRDLVLWPLGRRRWFRVSGRSMEPVLNDGEFVLVNTSAFQEKRPTVGDVVVAEHPYRSDTVLIKRVTQVEGQRVELLGDSPAQSTDSRTLGRFSTQTLIGRVVGKIQ